MAPAVCPEAASGFFSEDEGIVISLLVSSDSVQLTVASCCSFFVYFFVDSF